MRKSPCNQCKYKATTQKILKTHVPTVHNHPPWLTDIVTVIVRADWPFQPVWTEYASEVDSDIKLDNHNNCNGTWYLLVILNMFRKITLIWSLITIITTFKL